MTRVRNATKRPLVRFKTGCVTGLRYLITARTGFVRGSTAVEHVESGMEAIFDPNGDDSGTCEEVVTPRVFTPQTYPEDGLEVVRVGAVPGEPMPLTPHEAARAFKLVQMNGAPSHMEWGILDEWDTVYEIREKETPCQIDC